MRIVHSTSIPVAAYEYRLPLVGIPSEADSEWRDWLAAFVDREAEEVRELLWQRFRGASAELCRLAGLMGEFMPFSLLIFEGTPLVWMEHLHEQQRDVIYLPPPSNPREVRAALEPFQLHDSPLLAEFLALFGGLGERYPCEDIEFAGRRRRGRTVLSPAKDVIEAGLEYKSPTEVQTLRQQFARWLTGVQLLNGGDGLYWHVGSDGSVCEHECGGLSTDSYFGTLPEMLAAFVAASRPGSLFHGAYHGFAG